MGPMDSEPTFRNANSDIHFPALLSVSPGNFTIEELCGMGDAILADPRGQKQFPFDSVCMNEVFNNALDMDTTSLWPEETENFIARADAWIAGGNKRKYEEVESEVAQRQIKFSRHEQCRAAVAEPGSQTPGIAVNGVALRLPHLELPADNHGATASGSHHQEVLNEPSQATPDPKSPIQCDECTASTGRPVTFSLQKDLRRHLTRTVTHNARPVARCSCGKTVTRKDAMRVHHRRCQGTTVPLDDAEGPGQGST